MPLFSSRRPEDEVVEEPAPVPEKKHSIFSSRRSREEEVVRQPTPPPERKHGLFHRSPSPVSTVRSGTTSHSDAASTSRKPSVLQRTFGHGSSNPEMDPSIVQAREHVMSAENAEREADRALEAARIRVREARAEVKRLEAEAAEEARRAKIKQYHAREVSKRGKQLGRHDL